MSFTRAEAEEKLGSLPHTGTCTSPYPVLEVEPSTRPRKKILLKKCSGCLAQDHLLFIPETVIEELTQGDHTLRISDRFKITEEIQELPRSTPGQDLVITLIQPAEDIIGIEDQFAILVCYSTEDNARKRTGKLSLSRFISLLENEIIVHQQ